MRVRRHCYDKPHRCPGWAGGGWKFPRPARAVCESGYLNIDYERNRHLEGLRFHRCAKCGTYALPMILKWIDPSYLKYRIRS